MSVKEYVPFERTGSVISPKGAGDTFSVNSKITGPHWRSREVFLDENYSNDKGIPTLIERGLFKGYSMDIWETPAKPFEELALKLRVPISWDGVTKPWVVAITSPTGAEDVDDKYKFQLEWMSKDVGAVIPDSIQETLTSEVTLSTGKNAAYFAHIIAFELTATTLVSGQCLQMRVRRVAASANEVTAEPAIWHWDSRWKMNQQGSDTSGLELY